MATPSPPPELGVLAVTALLDLSGERGPSGNAQRNALQLWLDRRGTGVPVQPAVRLKVVDVAGSDARLLIELRRAAEEDRADAVIVGSPVAMASTFGQVVALAALPVVLTLPFPEPVAQPGGRWIFALAPAHDALARYALGAPAAPGVTLELTSGSPASAAESTALREESSRRGAQLTTIRVDRARDDPPLATLARTLAVAGRVHVTGAPREYAGIAQAIQQSATAATFQLSYLADPADLGDFRDRAIDATWAGSRNSA
ncbi:MAG: ABC transporter substrate-binding protein, partial [Candidatus Limnocylindria bacterium]